MREREGEGGSERDMKYIRTVGVSSVMAGPVCNLGGVA